MKRNYLVILLPCLMLGLFAMMAFNSGKSSAGTLTGISEMASDSMKQKGRTLIQSQHYTDDDLQAISVYLQNRN